MSFTNMNGYIIGSNMTSFFRFVKKPSDLSIGYNLISICAGVCD